MSEPQFARDGSDLAAADTIAEAIAGSDAPLIAFPGGSTPASVFDDLASRPLDWARVTLTPTDERLVPADHPASNLRLLSEAFADTGARIVPLEEGLLARRPALVCLGMGTDGHVASLFPTMETEGAPWSGEPRVIAVRPQPLPRKRSVPAP